MKIRAGFFRLFIGFVVFNILLYFLLTIFHKAVPFHKSNYVYNAHHFLQDERVNDLSNFSFLRAMGQYDAQWYLKIAKTGYPESPKVIEITDKSEMDALTYAFFPLFPLMVRTVDLIINNIELSAFLLVNTLMLANFGSIYFVTKKLVDENTAQNSLAYVSLSHEHFLQELFYRRPFSFPSNLFWLLFNKKEIFIFCPVFGNVVNYPA